jgi:sugar lactone lactonase YvrE
MAVPRSPRSGTQEEFVRLSIRLPALATATIAGLTLTVTGTGAATALAPQQALASTGVRAAPGASAAGGARLWVARFRDHDQQNDAQAVVTSPDGSTAYVTGLSGTDTGQSHITTVAYHAATGTRRWVARYFGLGVSGPTSVAISPDGSRLFVAGFTVPPGSALPTRFAVVAYNASTGAMLWAQHPFNSGTATSVAVSPDSATVYATGTIGDQVDGRGSVATFAFDAATGARRWLAVFHGMRPSAVAQSVAASPDGQKVFVLSPVTSSSGNRFLATLAYGAATGAAVWTRFASGTADTPEGIGVSQTIAVSPDSSAVFITGASALLSTSTLTTIGYSAATGQRLWTDQYRGPQGNNAGNAVTVSPDGSQVFVTGHSNGTTSPYAQNFATVAYATSGGRKLWARTFSSPSSPEAALLGAVALGVSPDGTTVYATGTAPGFRSNSTNAITVAYRTADGATSWSDRYRGRRDFAGATDLAVSPAGQAVFVTGFVGVHDGCCDFNTIAYQP